MITEKMLYENSILTSIQYVAKEYIGERKIDSNLPPPSELYENWVVQLATTEFYNDGLIRKKYKRLHTSYTAYKCLKTDGEYIWYCLGDFNDYLCQCEKYYINKRFKNIEDRLAALEEKLK